MCILKKKNCEFGKTVNVLVTSKHCFKKMYKTKNVIQALLFISANLNANN